MKSETCIVTAASAATATNGPRPTVFGLCWFFWLPRVSIRLKAALCKEVAFTWLCWQLCHRRYYA